MQTRTDEVKLLRNNSSGFFEDPFDNENISTSELSLGSNNNQAKTPIDPLALTNDTLDVVMKAYFLGGSVFNTVTSTRDMVAPAQLAFIGVTAVTAVGGVVTGALDIKNAQHTNRHQKEKMALGSLDIGGGLQLAAAAKIR